MSTANRLILIFRNNTRTPLLTLRCINAAKLEYNSTSCTLNSLTLSVNYNKSIGVGFNLKRMHLITAQLLIHVGNEPKRKLKSVFQMTVEKPKPRQLLRPIVTRTNSVMNQSQFVAIACNSPEAREKSLVHYSCLSGFLDKSL